MILDNKYCCTVALYISGCLRKQTQDTKANVTVLQPNKTNNTHQPRGLKFMHGAD